MSPELLNRHIRRAALGLTLGLWTGLVGCVAETTHFESTAPSDVAHYGEGFDTSEVKKPTVRTLHAMARITASQGRDPQAELVLGRLIAEHPHYMPAYAELSELYLRSDMVDAAADVLRKGLELAPTDVVLRNNLGMCHLFLRDYEGALDQFQQAAVDAPADARSRANMAVTLALMGRMDEAEALYLQIMPKEDAWDNMELLSELTGFAWERPAPPTAEDESVEEFEEEAEETVEA